VGVYYMLVDVENKACLRIWKSGYALHDLLGEFEVDRADKLWGDEPIAVVDGTRAVLPRLWPGRPALAMVLDAWLEKHPTAVLVNDEARGTELYERTRDEGWAREDDLYDLADALEQSGAAPAMTRYATGLLTHGLPQPPESLDAYIERRARELRASARAQDDVARELAQTEPGLVATLILRRFHAGF